MHDMTTIPTAMDDSGETGFEHAPLGLVISRDRMIGRCNRAFCAMFGYAREGELAGKSLSLLYPSTEEFQRIGTIGLKQMRATGFYVDERIMKRRDGELFWCRVRGQSLTPNEPFAHAVWSFADLSGVRPITHLSKRERQVAMYLTEGHTSKEIARLLEISPRTVEAHRARLIEKLEARNGAELIARLTGTPL